MPDEMSDVPVEDIGALEVACESEVTSSPFIPSVPPSPVPAPTPSPAIASALGAFTYLSPACSAVPENLASSVLTPIGSMVSVGIPIVSPFPSTTPVAPVPVEAPTPIPVPASSAAMPAAVPALVTTVISSVHCATC
ncbi:hypothetical protein HPB50_017203 [Hyalomma asiaticum]|uniref:Uncharacterized protein n=1 Tax=Hyalomma asiaticum TaxID=266040 RepID=A0ACB7S9F3_HYAAI|nr:hypothetical protein HPB50_017203 [Hyalomma asiaticum]